MPCDVAKKIFFNNNKINNSNIEKHSVNPTECISYQLEFPINKSPLPDYYAGYLTCPLLPTSQCPFLSSQDHLLDRLGQHPPHRGLQHGWLWPPHHR